MLGLAPVQHVIEGSMTEIATSYARTALNGCHWPAASKVGTRMAPIDGEPPYGSGSELRFALRTRENSSAALVARFASFLEPEIRSSAPEAGIALVRPDGYLALSAGDGDWEAVADYFTRQLTSVADGGAAGPRQSFSRIRPRPLRLISSERTIDPP
ncbi:MAG: hypothetical protein QM813_15050 [Verrucomicrobiota bacterium]